MSAMAFLTTSRALLIAALLFILGSSQIDYNSVFNLTIRNSAQWHAPGFWHGANTFPLCTMDACFNFSRCASMQDFLIYVYGPPYEPFWYFHSLLASPYVTADPNEACVFIILEPIFATLLPLPHPHSLPHWNGGLNHIIASLSDKYSATSPNPHSIGNASVLASCLQETTYRPGFDISIPLPGRIHLTHLQDLKPWNRKYLLTFKGTRYLGNREGNFRSDPAFLRMHNGKDVIIAVSCKHATNKKIMMLSPHAGKGCDEDEMVFRRYGFEDLMNSTFALAPAGRSSASYRLIEALSAGAIPVLIADNYVKPFDTMIHWHQCVLQFPTSEVARILSAVRSMGREEMERRQRYCLYIYREYLKDDATLVRSVVKALKLRFYGVLPQFNESISSTMGG